MSLQTQSSKQQTNKNSINPQNPRELKTAKPTLTKFTSFAIMITALTGLLATSLSSCSHNKNTLWIFSASSLINVFEDLGAAYEKNTDQEIDIKLQFGGSSSLVRQINDGAPASLLATANEKVLDELDPKYKKQGYEKVKFAMSELVMAVPEGNPKNITSFRDLANRELKIGQCQENVPCGDLANKINAYLIDKGEINEPIKASTYESSARSVLQKLLAGELDVALIYKVDVLAANNLIGITIDNIPQAIRENNYFLTSLQNEHLLTRSFIDFITTNEKAKQILKDHGFKVPQNQ